MSVPRWLSSVCVGLVGLALCGPGCAVQVQGVVRDSLTQRPIAGAVVRIGDSEATSDAEGAYSLQVLPRARPQPVRLRAPGYREAIGEQAVGDTTQPIHLHFELSQAGGEGQGPDRRGAAVALPASAGREETGSTGGGVTRERR